MSSERFQDNLLRYLLDFPSLQACVSGFRYLGFRDSKLRTLHRASEFESFEVPGISGSGTYQAGIYKVMPAMASQAIAVWGLRVAGLGVEVSVLFRGLVPRV